MKFVNYFFILIIISSCTYQNNPNQSISDLSSEENKEDTIYTETKVVETNKNTYENYVKIPYENNNIWNNTDYSFVEKKYTDSINWQNKNLTDAMLTLLNAFRTFTWSGSVHAGMGVGFDYDISKIGLYGYEIKYSDYLDWPEEKKTDMDANAIFREWKRNEQMFVSFETDGTDTILHFSRSLNDSIVKNYYFTKYDPACLEAFLVGDYMNQNGDTIKMKYTDEFTFSGIKDYKYYAVIEGIEQNTKKKHLLIALSKFPAFISGSNRMEFTANFSEAIHTDLFLVDYVAKSKTLNLYAIKNKAACVTQKNLLHLNHFYGSVFCETMEKGILKFSLKRI